MRHQPWYKKGLRFSCRECGRCCTVEGYVWVGGAEIRRIAGYLDLPRDVFGSRFLRRVGSRLSLIEREDGPCIFWDRGCSVYDVRPQQCRTFPFWSEHLASAEAWERVGLECRGVGGGELYELADIEKLQAGEGETRLGAVDRPEALTRDP